MIISVFTALKHFDSRKRETPKTSDVLFESFFRLQHQSLHFFFIAKRVFSPPIVSPPTPKQAKLWRGSMEEKQRKSLSQEESKNALDCCGAFELLVLWGDVICRGSFCFSKGFHAKGDRQDQPAACGTGS
jgi:hypothetical protein